MSLAILGLFKAITPLLPATARRFAPAGSMSFQGNSSRSTQGVDGQSCPPTPRAPTSAPRSAAMPLRVTRLLDQGSHSAGAGRMVMSGRFADVCAELDRLVALETAREATRTRH